MKTLSFPGPWGCCFWIISAMCLLAVPACSQPDRLPDSIQHQPVLLCNPVCLLGYRILSPCTDKEAIFFLSFIPVVKLFTRAACFVQGDD